MSTEPTPEETADQIREAFQAIGKALHDAWQAFADELMKAFNAPGVREALIKGARAGAAQCREEAALKRLAADPDSRDGFLQLIAKNITVRDAERLLERATELDDAADSLERIP